MKKGTKIKIVTEQKEREPWMVLNNFYWCYAKNKEDNFVKSTLKVGNVYEVVKARGVKGPGKGYIEVKNEREEVFFVLKEDVEELED